MNLAMPVSTTDAVNSINLDHLLVELEHYRRQSQWLQQVNELNARLASATDLRGMVEAFSVWLMPVLPHDLIAYRNREQEKVHIVCSAHGPDRRLAMQVAEEVFQRVDCLLDESGCQWGSCHVRQWKVSLASGQGCLMLLRRDRAMGEEEAAVMRGVLGVLGEPLQRAMLYEDLFEQAKRDMLTGLANRRVFAERVGPLLDLARRHRHPITLACMDLDHFKQINDNLGHAAGDEALRMVARTMTAMVRSSDLLARMGGDEFVLVLPDTDIDSARVLADRICRAIDGLELRSGDGSRLGMSIGLVQWRPELGREEWLQRADEVLYRAKKTGRSRVCAEGDACG